MYPYPYPMKTILAQNTKIALSNICKLMAAILNFSIDHCYFSSIVKNEFLTPKYPRIEVLVMIVAPQNQFYIETNLAICSFTQFAQYAHKKNFPKLPQQQQR